MATVKFFIRHKDKKKSAIRAIVSFFGAQYPVAIGVLINPRLEPSEMQQPDRQGISRSKAYQ